MGLDAVELVMAIEDGFDLRIEDDDAVRMRTPRDVIDYVWSKVAHADATGCQTQRAFNLLRKTLVESTGLSRREIRPAASLNALIPKARRNEMRQQFNAILCTHAFPELVRPRWLVSALMAICTVAGLATSATLSLLHPGVGVGVTLLLGVVAAGLAGYISAAATRKLRSEFPPLIATAGDLSRWIMCHRRDSAATSSTRGWTREQVSAQVREIVVEQLACAATYHENARFIDNLGAD